MAWVKRDRPVLPSQRGKPLLKFQNGRWKVLIISGPPHKERLYTLAMRWATAQNKKLRAYL